MLFNINNLKFQSNPKDVNFKTLSERHKPKIELRPQSQKHFSEYFIVA